MTGRFGLSTRLFARERLEARHLEDIAASGFPAVQVLAHRPHFDHSDLTAPSRLASWAASAGLELHALQVAPEQSLASGDEATRAHAVEEVRAVLETARRLPFRHLVVRLGAVGADARATDHQAAAARRSLEQLAGAAAPLGVRLAVELVPNTVSNPESLVRLIEDEFDETDIGICLDYGHAHLMGDLADAIETVAGHVVTAQLHDNRRRANDQLPPFAGSIDWDAAMMETQKIGYDGRLVLDVAPQGNARDTLARCAAARDRLAQAFEWPT